MNTLSNRKNWVSDLSVRNFALTKRIKWKKVHRLVCRWLSPIICHVISDKHDFKFSTTLYMMVNAVDSFRTLKNETYETTSSEKAERATEYYVENNNDCVLYYCVWNINTVRYFAKKCVHRLWFGRQDWVHISPAGVSVFFSPSPVGAANTKWPLKRNDAVVRRGSPVFEKTIRACTNNKKNEQQRRTSDL